MDLTSDFPFWTVKNGLMTTYPALRKNLRCDCLIVGGGISGALLAHQLVKRSVDCVLIDRRNIGHGSTSASTALLQYEIDTPLHELRKKVGDANANRAYLLGIDAIDELHQLAGKDCAFALRPSLQVATRQSDAVKLRHELAARRELRLPVELLSKSDLGKLNIRGYAALKSRIAAEVDPYRLTHSLLARASKSGLQIYDRTNACQYIHSKRGVTAVTDAGFEIRCRAIMFASGYEVRELLPKNVVTFKSTYACISEPCENLDWWKDRALIWGTGNPYLYMRTTSDRRVLVGGKDDLVLDPKRRDKSLAKKTNELLRSFQTVFPGRTIEPAFCWAGAFGGTKDGLGYIGPHQSFPHAYFALGFGGNGITFSQIGARILSDLFTGRKNQDVDVFAFSR